MPKPANIPCLDIAIAAAEETLGTRDAGRVIRTMIEMAETQQARYGDNVEDAIKKVNRRMKGQRAIEIMNAKRNTVLNLAKIMDQVEQVEEFAAGGKISRMEAYTDFLIAEQGLKRGEDGQILSTRMSVGKQQVHLLQEYIGLLDKGLANAGGEDLRKIFYSAKLSEEITLELGHMVTEREVVDITIKQPESVPAPKPATSQRVKSANEARIFLEKAGGNKEAAYRQWLQDMTYVDPATGKAKIDKVNEVGVKNIPEARRQLFEELLVAAEAAKNKMPVELNPPAPKQGKNLNTVKVPEWDRRTTSYLLERGDVDPIIAKQAKQIADVIYDLREQMFSRHGLAGGLNDPKAMRMITPTHNVHRITKGFRGDKAGAYANWREKIIQRLDMEKTFDGIKDVEAELWEQFGRIVSECHGGSDPTLKVDNDGVPIDGPRKKNEPTFFIRKGSLAKRGSKQDFFVFKSPEDFWAYNQEFGSLTLNDAIASELHYYSHSTALMENMGSDPDGTFTAVMKILQEKDKNDHVIAKDAKHFKIPPRTAFEQVTGYLDNPGAASAKKVNSMVRFFKWQQAISKLVGMPIAAISDVPQVHFTLTYHGVSQADAFMANIMALTPKALWTDADKEFASQVCVGLDARAAAQNSRYTLGGGEPRAAWQRKSVDAMFAFNRMHQWNDGHKEAVATALMHSFGLHAGKDLDQLPADMSKSLRMYGITDSDWKKLSSVATQASDGRVYIMPENIRKLAGDNPSVTMQREINGLAMKFGVWISDIANEAVITPGARERIYARMGTKKGSAAGALIETLNYFRSFPITITSKILMRELQGFEGQFSRRFARNVGLLASSAIAGYVSGAIRDTLNGKTPKPLLNKDGSPNFAVLADSIARGGAFGIYSDLLFFEYDKSYRSILSTAAGPVIGTGVEALTLAGKTIRGVASDEIDVPEPHQYTKFLQANTPLIGLPVIKLGLDMVLFNHINEAMEPGYLREMKRGLNNRTGQEFLFDGPVDIWSD